MLMTKKEFIEIFGEHPIDVLGADWHDYIAYNFEEEELSARQEGEKR